MARTNDFAFVFRGGIKGVAMTFDLNSPRTDVVIDTKAYLAKAGKNRQLVAISTGSDGKLQPNLDALMKLIRDKTGNKLDTIGAFCAVGSSNGCSLVLALAAELKKAGAPQLSYVGVTDVTMQPFGRDPLVPNIGNLRPVGPPTFSSLFNKTFFFGTLRTADLAKEEPPLIKMDSAIDARKKHNFFQTEGNHAKFMSRNRPVPGEGWWWTSSITEVHGKVDGFDDNRKFDASGTDDQALHDDICEGKAFKEMLRLASQELADFPV
jgi:hypothetical protein